MLVVSKGMSPPARKRGARAGVSPGVRVASSLIRVSRLFTKEKMDFS